MTLSFQGSCRRRFVRCFPHQVRGVWVLAGTGTESHDKFRKTLSDCPDGCGDWWWVTGCDVEVVKTQVRRGTKGGPLKDV